MKQLARILFAAVLGLVSFQAHASLFTMNYGTEIAALSDCDDCASSAIAFGGGQTINYFGNTYSALFVSSNGYVTFDGPHTVYSADAVDMRTDFGAVAGLVSDLSTKGANSANILVNTDIAGQIIVTFDRVFHSGEPDSRSTFQLVIRSDQFNIPGGEGQVGFFYGSITDVNLVSAGIGDGTADVLTGEASIASQVEGVSLSNSEARWYTLNNVGGAPTEPTDPGTVPEPDALMLVGGAMLAALLARWPRRGRRS